MTFSELFYEACARFGQKQVAYILEIDISKVSRTKNGEMGLTNKQIDLLLEKMGMTIVNEDDRRDYITTIRTLSRELDRECKKNE